MTSETGRSPEEWGPIVVGRPMAEFEPRPQLDVSYRPDTVADGWSSSGLVLRLASVRGYSHRYSGRPREDDAAAYLDPQSGCLLVAVADGVSSAALPHIAATLACRSAIQAMLSFLSEGRKKVDWSQVVRTAAWQLVERAAQILDLAEPAPARTAELLATTLVAGMVVPVQDGYRADLIRVGDSSAWLLRDGRFEPAFPPTISADGVLNHMTLALPSVPSAIEGHTFDLTESDALVIGTDGFAGPLGDGDGQVGRLFAASLASPPPALGLAHLLDFSRETYDDDRTLVAIWPRRSAKGV